MSERCQRCRIRPHISPVTTGRWTKPSFTFINLSHPDKVKDREGHQLASKDGMPSQTALSSTGIHGRMIASNQSSHEDIDEGS